VPQTDASSPTDAGIDAASSLIDAALQPKSDAGDAAVDPCLGKAERVGDVHIFNEYDLAEAQCFETIQGSLTIENSALWDLPLPKLREVSSDVAIVYTAQTGTTTICGGTSANRVRSVSLPALRKVGRDLSLTIARNGEAGDASLRVDFGLSNLKTVGGDVAISTNAGDLFACGLDADTLDGDVAFSFAKTNAVSAQLFSRTTKVGGTISVHTARTVGLLFPALTEAGGLELTDLSEQVTSVVPATTLQTLHVERTPSIMEVPVKGALMDLRLIGTGYNTLSNADGTPRFSLAASASLSLRQNGSLNAAQICSFVKAQSDAGWHGSADLDVSCP
jgi:hypothetical protein